MATRAERASSFGAIADDYDRLRPSPPAEAVDWLVPEDCRVAVDLAAGTGLFTRPLADRVPHVIAVEPDPRMREVLAERSPEVEVVEGSGEAIPLADDGVDAVFVSSAWHWLDESLAVPEIARVLRPGGRLGVLWTARDRDIEWVRELDRLPGDPLRDPAEEDKHRWRREVAAEYDDRFDNVARRSFGFTRRMAVEDVVAMVGTYSGVLTAPEERRTAILDTARETLQSRHPGRDEIAFPMRSWCWRAELRIHDLSDAEVAIAT